MPKSAAHVRRRLGTGAVWIAVLAYGWWFTDREPFSPGALRALFVAVVVVVVVAEVRRERPVPSASGAAKRRLGFGSAVVVWSALVTAIVAWELVALRSSPRSAHPTISSLIESAEQYHLVRLALYASWIWFGSTMVS